MSNRMEGVEYGALHTCTNALKRLKICPHMRRVVDIFSLKVAKFW